MQTISTPRTDLEDEQLEDMSWACTVLAGRGDQDDHPEIATAMLQTLALHGTSDLVRRASAGAWESQHSS